MAENTLPDRPIDPSAVEIPRGRSVVHARPDSTEVWRLCCRLRLEMREFDLKLPEVHRMVLLAYPDLKISQKEFRLFLENYVDGSLVGVDTSFFMKGLMRGKAKLNAVAAAADVAHRMKEEWEKSKVGDKTGLTLPQKLAGGERVHRTLERQHKLQKDIGFGVPRLEDQAKPATIPQVVVEKQVVHFHEAIGGSFRTRRAASRILDVDPKPPSDSAAQS